VPHTAGRRWGGWKLGNSIDGCQAEYVLIPDAMINLAPVPDSLTDEQVLMCPDIMSTGFSGVERGDVSVGDCVAIFAQGPIGLCATAGAKLCGATTIIAVDRVPERLAMAKRMGADHVIDYSAADPVAEILRLTEGRGVDVAFEAFGTQSTFESCLRVLRPGGALSSLGVYSTDLTIPFGAYPPDWGITGSSRSVQAARNACGVCCRSSSPAESIWRRWTHIGSSSMISRRPTICSLTRGTAS
jgi:alcohol dehydrogenase